MIALLAVVVAVVEEKEKEKVVGVAVEAARSMTPQ